MSNPLFTIQEALVASDSLPHSPPVWIVLDDKNNVVYVSLSKSAAHVVAETCVSCGNVYMDEEGCDDCRPASDMLQSIRK